MAGQTQPGRDIQGTSGDAHRREPGRVPEQAGAALAAEAAPRPRVAAGTVDPAKAPLLDQLEILLPCRRGRRDMAVPSAALLAVADQYVLKRARHRVSDGST